MTDERRFPEGSDFEWDAEPIFFFGDRPGGRNYPHIGQEETPFDSEIAIPRREEEEEVDDVQDSAFRGFFEEYMNERFAEYHRDNHFERLLRHSELLRCDYPMIPTTPLPADDIGNHEYMPQDGNHGWRELSPMQSRMLDVRLQEQQNAEVETISSSDDPEEAWQRYFSLREHCQRERIQDEIDDLRAAQNRYEGALRDLSDRIERLQQQRNETLSELRKYQAIDLDELEPPDEVQIGAEFQRLMSLPGVESIRVMYGDIRLLLKARYQYQGVKYDFGDWELRFGTGSRLHTRELRSGAKEPGFYHPPVYRLSRSEFCFGGHESTINDNLRKGQFLEAVELAINAMQSVNEGHEHLVPEAFHEASD